MEMSPTEIHQKLMGMGVSDLDAGLVVNCINRKSAYTWLNTDPITKEQIIEVNRFLEANSMGIEIELSEVPYQGKFIWDVKVLRPASSQPASQVAAPPPAQGPTQFEGKFRSISELGF